MTCVSLISLTLNTSFISWLGRMIRPSAGSCSLCSFTYTQLPYHSSISGHVTHPLAHASHTNRHTNVQFLDGSGARELGFAQKALERRRELVHLVQMGHLLLLPIVNSRLNAREFHSLDRVRDAHSSQSFVSIFSISANGERGSNVEAKCIPISARISAV